MFETSAIRAVAAAPRRRAGLLTLSLAAHSIVIAAVVAAGLASIRFPTEAPNQFARLIPIEQPPEPPMPKGQPDAPPKPAAHTPTPATAPATPAPQTAPNSVPDTITPASTFSNISATPGPGTGEATHGSLDGVDGGIDVNQTPQVAVVPSNHGPYTPGGDVHAARVLSRVEPLYPRAAVAARISGVVKLQCVIDKSGQVRDATVVASSFAAFTEPALAALRKWTFEPGSLHGQPVDTYFELTITFHAQ